MTITTGCSKPEPPKTQDNRSLLLSHLASIEPWRADGKYSRPAWNHTIEVAKEFQAADPEHVAAVLDEFVHTADWQPRGEPGRDYEDVSRPFLLFRVLFDLPQTNIPSVPSRFFKGWRPIALSSTETLPQSWPVFWTNGQPYLAAPWEGSSGRDYAVTQEYRFFLRTFPFRNLSNR